MISNWQLTITQAIRQSKITVVGQTEIPNKAQADVGIALINAYDHPNAIIYFEASSYNQIEQPGDIVLVHPDIGVFVIEVKAYSIDFIQRIQGNRLVVQYKDQATPSYVNPLHQASSVMFGIKSRTQLELASENIDSRPMFNIAAAFPNIKTSEWRSRGFDNSYPNNLLLFQEHCANPNQLQKRLAKLVEHKNKHSNSTLMEPQQIEAILRAIGDSDAVNRARPPRILIDQSTLGNRIDELLSIEKHISEEQRQLSYLPIEGYPRLIRGVAGSGKTIVLTKMVARYLAHELSKPKDMFNNENRPLRVAVLCFNRTLIPMLSERIRQDFVKIAHKEIPDDTQLIITHLNGLMKRHCWEKAESVTPEQCMPYIKISGDMRDADLRASKYREQLTTYEFTCPYDAIFIDEAQDLAPTEFQLLSDMAKTNPNTGEKNIVIFYDDAQNLYGRTRPVWKSLDIDVQRGQRSHIMKVCYRNTQEIVELGFNVLLGSQSPDDIKVKTRQYADINYLLHQKLVEDLGDHIKINFTQRHDRKPVIREFATRDQEVDYLKRGLYQLIVREKVRPEDILILFPSSKEYNTLQDQLMDIISDIGVIGFVKPYKNKDKDTLIFRPNHLTLSTIHGAKGYDAQVVFLIGTDLLKTDITSRSTFYVGVTRAIMAIYVTGIKSAKTNLLDEALLVNKMI